MKASPQSAIINQQSAIGRWLDHLGTLSTPQFGQVVTWVLLAACYLLAALHFERIEGTRQGPATVFSWLPELIRNRDATFYAFRALLLVGTTLWLFNRALPWSCWLATLGFTGLWSLHMETTTNGAHIFNAANQLLVIQSLWHTFFARDIRAALTERRFWSTPLYPNWVFLLGLFYLGLFHTSAGLAKCLHSGLDWPNGVSLQLWAYWDGRPGSWMREAMINYRPAVVVMQWLTLIFETAAILGLFSRRLRPWIGLMLVSFYTGVLLTFDYGFHLNLVLTALYFLPFDKWLPHYGHQRPGVGGRESLAVENLAAKAKLSSAKFSRPLDAGDATRAGRRIGGGRLRYRWMLPEFRPNRRPR